MEWFIYALRNTFNYQGRAKRAEFIWFILIYELSDWAIVLIAKLAFALRLIHLSDDLHILNSLLDILLLLPMSSVTVRRLHDLGYSGWWQSYLVTINLVALTLTYLIPKYRLDEILSGGLGIFWSLLLIIYLIQIFYLMLKRGQSFTNRYGQQPD
ncbi:DUF805 domain-containing protein [Actinobacillus genomosp. 1]|uniref:DUF805 domain-containing protein n=1 Tax=Actinobacillus genomosp. 1 TaxID=254839 RepID=UPI002442C3CF|nr:DUF805 domain-containing protein [Actinobacillus genomosp. 1]WGE91396.1 DUF805 domain-containing protein [Actinobacillus genomosp. 1]